jgi:hypothetical protein
MDTIQAVKPFPDSIGRAKSTMKKPGILVNVYPQESANG